MDGEPIPVMKADCLMNPNDRADPIEEVDCIIGPVTPTAAFQAGEKVDDPLAMYLCDTLTVPANLAGIPALSVPCGQDDDGLPIGLQLMGPALGEPEILQVGAVYQQNTDHHLREPAL